MNKVMLIGNLTKNPELRTTTTGLSVCTFTVAVQRARSKDGEKAADYISCVAWRKTAEAVSKYLTKGKKVGVVGQLQTRTYEDKDGKKVYVTEVVCDEYGGVEFLSPRGEGQAASGSEAAAAAYGAVEPPQSFVEVDEEELPF